MPSPMLSRVIRYYRQCYQASFHASDGHGLFDRDDVVPLATFVNDPAEDICVSESQLSAWLVDRDSTELLLLSRFVLHPSPNASFTTDVHYAPTAVLSTADLISNSLKHLSNDDDDDDQHFTNMLRGINLDELRDSAATYDDLLASDDVLTTSVSTQLALTADNKPKPEQLKTWFIKQSKKLLKAKQCNLHVLALVPKGLRSYRAKEEFVNHLDQLADNSEAESNFPLLRDLLTQQPSQKQPEDIRALLNKGARLGFGEKLVIPSLSQRQTQAIQNSFKHSVSLLQGPPGTGKTHALANLTVVLASLNKSVLLTAPSDAALDVLQQQLVETMQVDRSLIVRFGKGQRHGRFGQQARRLIKQIDKHKPGNDVLSEFESLLGLFNSINQSRIAIERSISAYPTPSSALLTGKGRFTEKLTRWFFWQRQHRNQGSLLTKIQALHGAIGEHQASLGAVASAALIQRFQRAFSRNSSTWSRQSQLIGNHSVHAAANLMRAKSEQPVALQSGLGIWLATLDDIPECTDGMFDWVIVDEATQANMASVIPALAVAKSLVVSGDPQQLRHYSFLSNAQEQRIADKLELKAEALPRFRSTSFYDFVHDALMNADQSQAITLLDEHYRSIPPLMRFNSEQFYNDDVKVLTGLAEDAADALHLSWQYVNGQRIDKINLDEITAVVKYLKDLIQKQAQQRDKDSIGVLSFFADQSEALKSALLSELSLQQIKDHRIKIGTPYSFQGAERDHMLISCAVDKNSVAGTWTYLNRADVFNVATSRARTQQTLFLSISPKELPASSVLRRYHDFSIPPPELPAEKSIEPWLKPLVNAIATMAEHANIDIEHHHTIADTDVDLLIRHNTKRLAIDLIGFPGDKGAAVHLSRYCTLERVGISLYPLTAFDWMFNPEQVIDDLKEWLQQKDSRLNQKLTAASLKKNLQPPALKTTPYLGPNQMTLVNEQVWRNFIECMQAPELSTAWGFDLNSMFEKLTQMDQLLPKLFKTDSITHLRYKSAINTGLDSYLENLSTYRLLHAQVWEANSADPDYWKTLTQPIFERHTQITDVLTTLHRDMQLEVAKGSTDDSFALNDLEDLAQRLKNY